MATLEFVTEFNGARFDAANETIKFAQRFFARGIPALGQPLLSSPR